MATDIRGFDSRQEEWAVYTEPCGRGFGAKVFPESNNCLGDFGFHGVCEIVITLTKCRDVGHLPKSPLRRK